MRGIIVLAVVAVALSVSNSGAAPQVSKTFEATAVPHRIETHFAPAGRAGNRDLLHWVINDRYGHSFGTATIRCDWYRTHERMCVGVFRLARGTFAVIGNNQNRSFGEFQVFAGTGDYLASHGSLQFNALARSKIALRGAFLS